MSQAQELEFLNEQAQKIRDQLAQITDRIKELEAR
jgi:prefoldin subunit 5